MAHESSAWRANDSVRFEAARDAADTSTALLFALADSGRLSLDEAIHQARGIRAELLDADGFDRDAIDALIHRLEARVAELRGFQS